DVRFGHRNAQDGTRPPIYAAVFGLGNSKLFPGKNQYDRFAKILRRFMEEPNVINLLLAEGLKSSDIGSATYISSCSNGGPPAAAICIRAGWTLHGVQETYIRYEAAGDILIGRYVAEIPFKETGFAVLPPLFPDIDDSIQDAIHRCISNIPSRMLRAGSVFY
ncbi:hypothetical protein JG688_00012825, partial [Phytophthora aleatoria]